MLEGAFRHAPLARFTPVQSLSREGAPELHLAKTKAGALVLVKVLVDAPIPAEIGAALARETAMAARLEHDAIAQTRAIVLEDDVAAMVTEFVRGVSLQRLFRFAATRGVRIPDEVALYVVERVLAALAHAHAQRDAVTQEPAPIVHGGVGPQSVVVGWDGAVKVVDFGDARMRALVTPLVNRTPADHDVDAPLVSPEQASGGAVTERSDVFCAALLAQRALTGRTPYARFRHSAAERLLAMSEADVAPLAKTRPDLAGPVRDALDRALAADPARREVTARELHDVVRVHVDVAAAKDALAKLLTRWREPLEQSMSPWEKRASMHDGAEAASDLREGTLALAAPDERPSNDALVAAPEAPDEPWKKGALAADEAPLAPTDPHASLSRVGSVAPNALVVSEPKMRITAPSLPTYDAGLGPKPPPVEARVRSGKVAAAIVFVVFALLVVGAIVLLKWLSGPAPS